MGSIVTDVGMRDLQAFTMLAVAHSYTVAADSLGMTQSALSKRIKELEVKLKVKLFDRTTRHVALTTEGREFLLHANNLLDQFDRSLEEIRESAAGNRGRLSIAAAPHMSANLLPPVVASFSKQHPEVEIRFHDCRSHETIRYILAEEADIGVTVMPSGYVGNPQIDVFPVMERTESLTVAFSRGHALEAAEEITWQSLKPFKIIPLRPTSAAVRLVDIFRNEEKLTSEPAFEVSLIDTALGMAAAGVGIVIFPQYVASRRWGDVLIYRKIKDTSLRVTFGLQHLKGRSLSGPARLFADHLRAHLAASNLF